MSKVIGGTVGSNSPAIDGNSPKMDPGYPTGSSTGGFTYVGTHTDVNKDVWIVLKASYGMLVTGPTSDGAGEIFDNDPANAADVFCCLNIGANGSGTNQDWTVRARTTTDGKGGGVTYSAGTGGAPGGA